MKKCAIINDMSGFGKCSLTASIPIISVMGSEVHPLPTAVLSNQTAYESFEQVDFTEYMQSFINQWKRLNVSFDAVLTGFVASEKQIDIISGFISDFKQDDTVIIIDPVMADNGALYSGYSRAMCEKIINLCYKADIITPNISELALIAKEDYSEDYDTIISYGKKIIDNGIKNLVVTGYKENDTISNLVFSGWEIKKATSKYTGGYYSGTGDVLASIITGGILKKMSLYDSVRLASDFISKVIENTKCSNHNDGIEFERYLRDLV